MRLGLGTQLLVSPAYWSGLRVTPEPDPSNMLLFHKCGDRQTVRHCVSKVSELQCRVLNLTLAAGYDPRAVHEYRMGAEETWANNGALLHIAISQACVPKWDVFLDKDLEMANIVQALKDMQRIEDLDHDPRCQDDFLFLAVSKLLGLLHACLKNGIDPQSRNKRGTSVTTYARKHGLLGIWKAALSETGFNADEVVSKARDIETGWTHEQDVASKQKQNNFHDVVNGRARLEQSNGFARDILSVESVLGLFSLTESPRESETIFDEYEGRDQDYGAQFRIPGQWHD